MILDKKRREEYIEILISLKMSLISFTLVELFPVCAYTVLWKSL